MPRRLGTLFATLFLALAGCDSSPAPGGFLVADVQRFSWFLPGHAASRPRMVYAFDLH
jgi:hypothetical protein